MGAERRPGVWSGRFFPPEDLDRLRRLIADHPTATRTELSHRACDVLNWRGADGRLRAMRMRVVMLRMHEAGILTLPQPRQTARRPRPDAWRQHAIQDPGATICERVDRLTGLAIHPVTARDRIASRTWNATIAAYHYLGYQCPVGHQLRYRIDCDLGPLACIGFASAAWKIAPRDQRIGWTHDQRERGLCQIVNNTRFLILPWVHVPNLASWILAACAHRLRRDWRAITGVEPLLLETFVDASRYSGHCYRAANWIHLGTTQGRGRYDRHTRRAVTPKHIWAFPLVRDPWGRLAAG